MHAFFNKSVREHCIGIDFTNCLSPPTPLRPPHTRQDFLGSTLQLFFDGFRCISNSTMCSETLLILLFLYSIVSFRGIILRSGEIIFESPKGPVLIYSSFMACSFMKCSFKFWGNNSFKFIWGRLFLLRPRHMCVWGRRFCVIIKGSRES